MTLIFRISSRMNLSCRHCQSPLNHKVIDLGHQPPSNAYLSDYDLYHPETYYPLSVYVCESCWLVQLPEHARAEQLFTSEYAYFSSTSQSWCDHAKKFVREAIHKLSLNEKSLVVEIASNDGYLLQYVKAQGIPCIGVEPTHSTAQSSRDRGIETIEDFFGASLAQNMPKADLVVANNVLAHVPEINDFMQSICTILKPKGVASIEFPHLLSLVEKNQFDTIYHEHYSYLSLNFVNRLGLSVGLQVTDVEEIPTHGGSLRVWLSHQGVHPVQTSVETVTRKEHEKGLLDLSAYEGLQKNAENSAFNLVNYLTRCKDSGRFVLGYGAAAKGNTLLNYAGVKPSLLPAIADAAPSKQGKFMPGSHIPIISPNELISLNPNAIIVFPWNLYKEISGQFRSYNLFSSMSLPRA